MSLPRLPILLLLACLASPAGAATATTLPPDPASALPPPRADDLDRRIAITIDDLPWVGLSNEALPEGGDSLSPSQREHHQRLMRAIREQAVPVVGFVNEGKLLVGDRVDTARVHLLRDWIDAGAELGNHTYGHTDFNASTLEEFEADILRGEIFLRPLLAEREQSPRWFRHPYLRTGRSAEDKAALDAFLAEHGYRVAPVTVDTSDWIWALAYRKSLANAGLQDGLREETLARLREQYVPYMLAKLDYFEQQSVALLGYDLPQILLMHANEINADCYPALIAGIRDRGYRFIALADAVDDPAYQRPDTYTGRWGTSWIHRWALSEGRPKSFFAGEPKVPAWVMDLAGVDSE